MSIKTVLLSCVLLSSVLPLYGEPIQAVGFAWEAPTTNTDGSPLTDLSHYTLKVGELRMTVPKEETTGIVTLDRALEHRAVVTASDLEGNESDPSNEVVVAQLVETPTPTPTPGQADCDGCCFVRLEACQSGTATLEAELVAVRLELKKAQDDLAAAQTAGSECARRAACMQTKYPLTYNRCP